MGHGVELLSDRRGLRHPFHLDAAQVLTVHGSRGTSVLS